MKKTRISIVGAGAWGTALAVSQLNPMHEVVLYARDSLIVEEINQYRTNKKYLPGIVLPKALKATADLSKALKGSDIIMLVVPAQKLRGFLESQRDVFPLQKPVILCSKGIEEHSGLFMLDVAKLFLQKNPILMLSGPSFAEDVAKGLPTAVTIASEEITLAEKMMTILSTPKLRCYASSDTKGVQIGSSLKNVLAIAAGIVDGFGLGYSARAALITRGFNELKRVGESLGARSETLSGLSGLGDLILTCSSLQSRNYSYGFYLAQKEGTAQLKLTEGVSTARIAAQLCKNKNIDAPVIRTVSDILDQKIGLKAAIEKIFLRPLKRENES